MNFLISCCKYCCCNLLIDPSHLGEKVKDLFSGTPITPPSRDVWITNIDILIRNMNISGPKTAPTTGQFTTGTLKKNVHSGSSDEDPYSLTPSGSSGSSGKGLRDRSREESGSGTRTRDSDGYGPQNWTNTNKGIPNDLSDDYVEVRKIHCSTPYSLSHFPSPWIGPVRLGLGKFRQFDASEFSNIF